MKTAFRLFLIGVTFPIFAGILLALTAKLEFSKWKVNYERKSSYRHYVDYGAKHGHRNYDRDG